MSTPSQLVASSVATCADRIVTALGLTSTRSTRWQVAGFMHLTRIDRSVAANYDRRLRNPLAGRGMKMSPAWSDETRPIAAEFPRVPGVFRSYELFSTLYMVVCLVKYTFFALVSQLLVHLYDSTGDGKLAGLPPECMIPGRVANHRVLRHRIGIVASLVNLIYRFWLWHKRRPYSFYVVDAAIQDQAALSDFYQLYNGQHLKRASGGGARGPIERHPFTQFMCHKVGPFKLAHSVHGRKLSSTGGGGLGGWRLRANMCPELVQRFRLDLAMAALCLSLILAGLILVVLPLSALVACSDRWYVYNYPGCDERLDRLAAANRLPWRSVTLTPHRCIMLVFDVVENCVFAVDSTQMLLVYTTLLILLNRNVLACWELVHAQVERALELARLERYSASELHHRADSRATAGGGGGSPASARLSGQILAELQPAIRDFFKQVSNINLLAGDLLTLSFLFWLLFLLPMVHKCLAHYLAHPDFLSLAGFTFPQLLLVGLAVLFVPTSLVSFTMFRLYPCCLKTYKLLGPLIAYNQLTGEKLKFADEIMEYYQHLRWTSYKILHAYPFKATTFLTLVGWNFTALGLIANLVSR